MSPRATGTGCFVWLYIAVVLLPSINGVTSTCGTLFVICSSFTPVMNFLKLKSKYEFGTVTVIKLLLKFTVLPFGVVSCVNTALLATYAPFCTIFSIFTFNVPIILL